MEKNKSTNNQKTGLRKGLTSYGDEEFSLFLRKAFIKGAGYTDDVLYRPIIGIVNTGSDSTPAMATRRNCRGGQARGDAGRGLPMVFPDHFLHESFAYPTSMFRRN